MTCLLTLCERRENKKKRSEPSGRESRTEPTAGVQILLSLLTWSRIALLNWNRNLSVGVAGRLNLCRSQGLIIPVPTKTTFGSFPSPDMNLFKYRS